MYSMVQAGSLGLPFIAVRGLLDSDLLKFRPDLKVEINPFNPEEEVVIAQPIRPEVAVFHALQADPWGNALTFGPRDDLMLARAARRVIVTAEEIIPQELTPRDAYPNTFLPALDVDAVVLCPGGAHPGSCGTLYGVDKDHLQEYLVSAATEESFHDYLKKYIWSTNSEEEYFRKVGWLAPGQKEKL